MAPWRRCWGHGRRSQWRDRHCGVQRPRGLHGPMLRLGLRNRCRPLGCVPFLRRRFRRLAGVHRRHAGRQVSQRGNQWPTFARLLRVARSREFAVCLGPAAEILVQMGYVFRLLHGMSFSSVTRLRPDAAGPCPGHPPRQRPPPANRLRPPRRTTAGTPPAGTPWPNPRAARRTQPPGARNGG